jgi:hypothetical protein
MSGSPLLPEEAFTPVHLSTVTRDESLGVVEFDYLGVRRGVAER